MHESRAHGGAVEIADVATIADGLATKKTDPEVFGIIHEKVDVLVTVSDREIIEAVRFLLERAKLLAEPAGAAAVAALLSSKTNLPAGARTVVVISGGNFDVAGRMQLGYEVW
jgi:threonine dehydratase